MDDETDKPIAIRDERGRLMPGSRLAVGHKNPIVSRVAELKHAMMAAVTPQDMIDIMERLKALTNHEDGKIALAAIELFQSRILGKPREHVEMDITTDATVSHAPFDAEDLAAMERRRQKLLEDARTVQDAEVIVYPQGANCN